MIVFLSSAVILPKNWSNGKRGMEGRSTPRFNLKPLQSLEMAHCSMQISLMALAHKLAQYGGGMLTLSVIIVSIRDGSSREAWPSSQLSAILHSIYGGLVKVYSAHF